ncbi:unnamed protein product [Penicillium nalgiovense]|uniref:Uncharacterized protein n=1 Tax=Penicillium nalgiovense TaxID=60175 RepID=A0A9W4IT99_PENNA|nr:unnamed protein product [Penicillium nalgiovense]CAG7941289.1 unnamed protein product [Penicillium nalgiovense]CAG7944283.1 unnamed protein product [Penicillium nalgiovense]CAG7945983.1 unnamed protein product [Penicillium nalgiovense]CAG7963048.1 unnamed protein product [Penicillium nalgiovense]
MGNWNVSRLGLNTWDVGIEVQPVLEFLEVLEFVDLVAGWSLFCFFPTRLPRHCIIRSR